MYLHTNNQVFNRYDLLREQNEEKSHTFSHDAVLQRVAEHVALGDEEKIIAVVIEALEHKHPQEVIADGLIAGMNQVSQLWSEGTYFLPQVVLSSDAMIAGIEVCEKKMGRAMEKKGKVVTHTAEGDIHDIGQIIVNALLKAAGYEVISLGADVPVDQVVRACQEHKPVMLGGTALMTTTMSAFPRIAAKLKSLNLHIPFACGGGGGKRRFCYGV